MPTIAQQNQKLIRDAIHSARIDPDWQLPRQNIKIYWKERQLYRSNKQITVYVANLEGTECYFRRLQELRALLPKAKYTTIKMTGREFGNLNSLGDDYF